MRWLDRCNPLAILLAVIWYPLPMLVTLDWVSGAVALALWLLLLPLAGVRPATIVRRGWLVLIAAPISALSMALYAAPGGRIYAQLAILVISDNSLQLALAIWLRVLAIGLPTVVLLGGLDPTRLADALGQVARLPAQFVLAALAGVRLFGLLHQDWRLLGLARRSRGLAGQGRLRRFAGTAFSLLVVALRRGAGLASAMEARGLGRGPRTWARPSRLTWRDPATLLATATIAALALGCSLLTGNFRGWGW